MRTLPEIFRAAIDRSFHIAPVGLDYLITENNEHATCRQVAIRVEREDDVFCFSIEKPDRTGEERMDAVFPYLNPAFSSLSGMQGLRSKNDAILLYHGARPYVFLIEMKSGNDEGYLRQLKLAKIFFEFIVLRLKEIGIDLRPENIEYRGLLFKQLQSRHGKKKSFFGKENNPYKGAQVDFAERGGLLCATLPCEENYRLNRFLS